MCCGAVRLAVRRAAEEATLLFNEVVDGFLFVAVDFDGAVIFIHSTPSEQWRIETFLLEYLESYEQTHRYFYQSQ